MLLVNEELTHKIIDLSRDGGIGKRFIVIVGEQCKRKKFIVVVWDVTAWEQRQENRLVEFSPDSFGS